MENNQKTTETVGQSSTESTTPTLFEQVKNWGRTKVFTALLGAGTFLNCTKDDPNNTPNTTTNLQKNTATSFILTNTTTDPDGDATTTNINITKNGQPFATERFTDNNFSKTYNNLDPATYVVKTVASDHEKEANDSDTIVINVPQNVDSTISNANPSVNENTTANIDLEIADQNGISSVDFVDSNSTLAQKFDLVNNTELQLKTGETLNHEAKSSFTGKIKVIDSLGNEKIFDVTVNLVDVQEQQILDIYGDGSLMPNGEAYAIKTDEEADGETLPVMYYESGTGNSVTRVTEVQINAGLSNGVYSSIQDDINGLHFTREVPCYPNGEPGDPSVHQAMISFDGDTNEQVIHADDGSELARIPRNLYGRQAQEMLDEIPNSDSDNFRKIGTVEYRAWQLKIIADTKNPTQSTINTHFAIKKTLNE